MLRPGAKATRWSVGLLSATFWFAIPAANAVEAKNFLVSLPLVTAGREGAIRLEYNLAAKGTVALDWAQWGAKKKREELAPSEIKEHPNNSLQTAGRDLAIMMHRYNNPGNMSGFNWGLGLGYRTMDVEWKKTQIVDNLDSFNHHVNATGPTASGRVGYRYVGSDLGFALGTYIGVKHFQHRIVYVKGSDVKQVALLPISEKDSDSLSRRLTTAVKIGIEIGWAF
jgi:hypothetical protein